MNAGNPDRKELLRERVLEQVRRDIILGSLKPDARLTERDLCERHSVSRTLAREVIRSLDAEGLGRLVPHQGLRITRMTAELVEEIYEVREALERLVVRAFIDKATPDQLAHLRYLFDRLQLLSGSDDFEELALRSSALSEYMVAVTGKQTVGELLASLNARIKVLRVLSMKRSGQVERGIAQLELLVAEITKRDEVGASEALRLYMAHALSSVLAGMPKSDTVEEPDGGN